MKDKDEKDEMRKKWNQRKGYKNPPVEHQFKKGQSGNPSGRPKGSKGIKAKIVELLDNEINLNREEGATKMIIREAQAWKAIEYALKGDIRYLQLIIRCEDEYLPQPEDERTKAERELFIMQRALMSMVLAPEGYENIDENGNAVDDEGNVLDPVDLALEIERKHKGIDQGDDPESFD